MGRALRVDLAGYTYHILNRANGKQKIFRKEKDYSAFEKILRDMVELFEMKLYAFEIMPSHWHLVISPARDGDIARFMARLTLTHTQRHHAHRGTTGSGHVYQGRYKSFIIQTDSYFYRVCAYVERNALRAGLVMKAETWRWGSAWLRKYGTEKQRRMLAAWPLAMPDDYEQSLNDDNESERNQLDEIRQAVNRGTPFGDTEWAKQIIDRFGLEVTTRPRGRPRRR